MFEIWSIVGLAVVLGVAGVLQRRAAIAPAPHPRPTPFSRDPEGELRASPQGSAPPAESHPIAQRLAELEAVSDAAAAHHLARAGEQLLEPLVLRTIREWEEVTTDGPDHDGGGVLVAGPAVRALARPARVRVAPGLRPVFREIAVETPPAIARPRPLSYARPDIAALAEREQPFGPTGCLIAPAELPVYLVAAMTDEFSEDLAVDRLTATGVAADDSAGAVSYTCDAMTPSMDDAGQQESPDPQVEAVELPVFDLPPVDVSDVASPLLAASLATRVGELSTAEPASQIGGEAIAEIETVELPQFDLPPVDTSDVELAKQSEPETIELPVFELPPVDVSDAGLQEVAEAIAGETPVPIEVEAIGEEEAVEEASAVSEASDVIVDVEPAEAVEPIELPAFELPPVDASGADVEVIVETVAVETPVPSEVDMIETANAQTADAAPDITAATEASEHVKPIELPVFDLPPVRWADAVVEYVELPMAAFEAAGTLEEPPVAEQVSEPQADAQAATLIASESIDAVATEPHVAGAAATADEPAAAIEVTTIAAEVTTPAVAEVSQPAADVPPALSPVAPPVKAVDRPKPVGARCRVRREPWKKTEWNTCGVDYRRPMPWPKVRGNVIDFHCHLFAARHAPVWYETARHFGIDTFVTMTPLEECVGLKRDWGDRIHFIAVPQWFYEGDDFVGDWVRRIEMFYNLGSRMAKFHMAPQTLVRRGLRLDSPELRPVFRELEARGMMVMTHVGDPETWYRGKYADTAKYGTREDHYKMWEDVLSGWTKLPWVGAHLGGNPEDLGRLQGLLDRHPNLYLDNSATRWMAREVSARRDEAREFIIRNADRILFGSDQVSGDDRGFDFLASRWWVHRKLWETAYIGPTPIHDPDLPDDQQPQLRGLALPDEVLQKLYHDNAVKVMAAAGVDIATPVGAVHSAA